VGLEAGSQGDRIVSTLLEILRPDTHTTWRGRKRQVSTLLEILPPCGRLGRTVTANTAVSTLLEILPVQKRRQSRRDPGGVSTLLEILHPREAEGVVVAEGCKFQPFLRFYASWGGVE